MTGNTICEIIISGFAVYGFIIALYEIKCLCLRQSKRKSKTEDEEDSSESGKSANKINTEDK